MQLHLAIGLKHIYLIKGVYSVVHTCCWLIRHLWHLRNLKNTFVWSGTNLFKEVNLYYSDLNILFLWFYHPDEHLELFDNPMVIIAERLIQTITWFHYFSANSYEDSWRKFETNNPEMVGDLKNVLLKSSKVATPVIQL